MFLNVLAGHPCTVRRRFGIAALSAVVVASSCAPRAGGKGVLPRPDPATVKPSPYQPEHPFELQPDGVFARQLYRTEGPAAFRTDILDLLIPPGKTATLKHEGVVVIETRDGTGAAISQEKRIPLRAGAAFGLSQGETARIENSGKEPLVVRVYRVTSQ